MFTHVLRYIVKKSREVLVFVWDDEQLRSFDHGCHNGIVMLK